MFNIKKKEINIIYEIFVKKFILIQILKICMHMQVYTANLLKQGRCPVNKGYIIILRGNMVPLFLKIF